MKMQQLPATFEEAAAIAEIRRWLVHNFREWVATIEAGHIRLRLDIKARLRHGDLEFTFRTIQAARAGHVAAHHALKEHFFELHDRGEKPSIAISAYVEEADYTPPVTYPPGRNVADHYARNQILGFAVVLALEKWPSLKATRNKSSKRPSACTLVAAAFNSTGFGSLTEWEIERIYANYLKIRAAGLSATNPPI
jgi:hypothetical protein